MNVEAQKWKKPKLKMCFKGIVALKKTLYLSTLI